MSQNPVSVFDITIKYDVVSKEVLLEWLNETAKHWVFQKEAGTLTGYVHWQIRISTRTKVRLNTLLNRMNIQFGNGFGNLSVTSKGEAETMLLFGKAFYCMKSDTRIEGPWSDKDPKPRYIQMRFRNAELKYWQKMLLKKIKKHFDDIKADRKIIMVCDEGGSGKSFFKGWCRAHLGIVNLPSTLKNAQEATQFLCSKKDIVEGGKYVIMMDVPRATHKKHWWSLAQGLESIRSGELYDARYATTEKIIEPPVLVCFMNSKPPEEVMTANVFDFFDTNMKEPKLMQLTAG